MREIDELIELLKEMKEMTGRMGNYELYITNTLISKLEKMECYSRSDMELSFLNGSKILYDSNTLEYKDKYKKFMQKQYGVSI